jgi:hypothetical protein
LLQHLPHSGFPQILPNQPTSQLSRLSNRSSNHLPITNHQLPPNAHTLGNRSAQALIYPTQKLAMQEGPHATTNAKASAFLHPSPPRQLHSPQLRRPLSASPGSEPQIMTTSNLSQAPPLTPPSDHARHNSVPGKPHCSALWGSRPGHALTALCLGKDV